MPQRTQRETVLRQYEADGNARPPRFASLGAKELRERRAKLIGEARAIYDANPGDRWTEQVEAEFDRKMAEASLLQGQIDRAQAENNALTAALEADPSLLALTRDYHGHTGQPRGMAFRDVNTGRTVRALLPRERLVDYAAVGQDLHAGRVLHALLSSNFDGLSNDERKLLAAHGGSDTSGGYLLPKPVSAMFVDLARSASVVFKAGAQTLPMDSAEMSIAGLSGDATGHWRAETTQIEASHPTFKKLVLQPRALGAIVPISIELIEDAPNVVDIIQAAVQAALSLKLDQAALVGIGAANEPRGVKNHPDVNAITGVGALTDYSDISAAVGDILAADYHGEVSDLAMIANPREGEALDKLEDSTGQPLMPTPWAAAIRKLWTTSLPTNEGGGANESSAIIGDFSQMLVGMRTSGVVIEVLPAGTIMDGDGTEWNATSQMLRHVRAYLRADVALLRPTHFTVLSGITP